MESVAPAGLTGAVEEVAGQALVAWGEELIVWAGIGLLAVGREVGFAGQEVGPGDWVAEE